MTVASHSQDDGASLPLDWLGWQAAYWSAGDDWRGMGAKMRVKVMVESPPEVPNDDGEPRGPVGSLVRSQINSRLSAQ
ncbi:MAG TPA: hypothetical protein DCY52_07215 [Methylococcaceae bacterium]|nr:hypothetical protein [Methylococcaceae bacterium]